MHNNVKPAFSSSFFPPGLACEKAWHGYQISLYLIVREKVINDCTNIHFSNLLEKNEHAKLSILEGTDYYHFHQFYFHTSYEFAESYQTKSEPSPRKEILNFCDLI